MWLFGGAVDDELLSFSDIQKLENRFVNERRRLLGFSKKKTSQQNSEKAPENLSALCLSGGGVRSASFCIGVMRALAEQGVLKNFDYLSTVSGGGFAGAFVSRWASEVGYLETENQLKDDIGFSKLSSPLSHLRRYISYLTPNTGLSSLDTTAAVGIVVRNALIIWTVLLPIFLSVAFLPLGFKNLLSSIEDSSEKLTVWLALITVTLAGVALSDSISQRPGWRSTDGGNQIALVNQNEDPDYPSFFTMFVLPLFASSIFATALFEGFQILSNAIGNDKPQIMFIFVAIVILSSFLWAFLYARNQVATQNQQSLEAQPVTNRALKYFRILRSLYGQIVVFTALVFGIEYFFSFFRLVRIDHEVIFGPLLLFIAYFVSEATYVAFLGTETWTDLEREWTARATGALLILPILWCLLCITVLWGPATCSYLFAAIFPNASTSTVVVSATTAASVLAFMISKAKSILEAGKKGVETWKELGIKRSLNIVLIILAFLLFSGLGNLGLWILKSLGTTALVTGISAFGFAILLIAFALTYDSWVDLNKYSLHGLYRNRLVRTFVGAANPAREQRMLAKIPIGFMDFLESDNVKMRDLGDIAKLCEKSKVNGAVPPSLLLINMSLNVPGSTDLALQERKALPFTASPFSVGSIALRNGTEEGCFRSSDKYASHDGRPLTLGTAIAISGAAVDPSMGHLGSVAMRFLFTFFNIRLGAWLANPGKAGEKVINRDSPYLMSYQLLLEFLGLANEKRAFVHLSDGGHFENLATYEALKRRCTFIVVVDAGCDAEYLFEDLGALQRIASVDLNANIQFPAAELLRLADGDVRFVVGSIVYKKQIGAPELQGTIVYIKPSLEKAMQPEISAYHRNNNTFPHETTANQWFSESQFLAYLRLGESQGRVAIDEMSKNKIDANKEWFS